MQLRLDNGIRIVFPNAVPRVDFHEDVGAGASEPAIGGGLTSGDPTKPCSRRR
jgi:hypothetical protein